MNALSPGWVVMERQLEQWLTPDAQAAWMKQVALQQPITSHDVARLAIPLRNGLPKGWSERNVSSTRSSPWHPA